MESIPTYGTRLRPTWDIQPPNAAITTGEFKRRCIDSGELMNKIRYSKELTVIMQNPASLLTCIPIKQTVGDKYQQWWYFSRSDPLAEQNGGDTFLPSLEYGLDKNHDGCRYWCWICRLYGSSMILEDNAATHV